MNSTVKLSGGKNHLDLSIIYNATSNVEFKAGLTRLNCGRKLKFIDLLLQFYCLFKFAYDFNFVLFFLEFLFHNTKKSLSIYALRRHLRTSKPLLDLNIGPFFFVYIVSKGIKKVYILSFE